MMHPPNSNDSESPADRLPSDAASPTLPARAAMSEPISLRASEAACLDALRSGTDRQALIALRAGLNLPQTKAALGTLASLKLAIINGNRIWHVTPRGKAAEIFIAPAVRTRGRPPVTEVV